MEKSKLNIGILQFAVNAGEETHLLAEHPLGSISRLIAELLSQRLLFLGFESSVAKFVLSRPEENTQKQLLYTEMFDTETIHDFVDIKSFDYCIFGEINFENELRIEITLLDSADENNIWKRKFTSKYYDFSSIINRIVEEIIKILRIKTDISLLDFFEKSTDNLKAWGWFAISMEDDLSEFDRESALIKAVDLSENFNEAKLHLISIMLGNDEKREQALEELEKLSDLIPKEMLNYFAQLLMLENKTFEAEIFFQYSLKKDMKQKNVLFNLVKANFILKNMDGCNTYIDQYMRLSNENDTNNEELPYYLFVTGNREKAIEYAKKAIALNPSSGENYSLLGFIYMNGKKLVEAAEAYEKAFSIIRNSSILEDWTSILLKLNKFEETKNIIETYTKDLEYNSGLDCNLAITYLNLGNKDKAIKILENSIKKDKNNPKTNALLGRMYLNQKSYARAQKYFLSATTLEPDNYYWNKNLGDLFYDIGDIKEALKHYNKVFESKPDFPISRYLCYQGKELKSQNKINEAYEKLNQSLKYDNQLVEPVKELGILFFENKEYDRAEEFFRKCLEIDPENPEIWFNLHKLYSEKSKGFFKKKWKIKSEESFKKYKEYSSKNGKET